MTEDLEPTASAQVLTWADFGALVGTQRLTRRDLQDRLAAPDCDCLDIVDEVHLASITATAHLRAGFPSSLTVAVRDGLVRLPGFGALAALGGRKAMR